jgi:hypothetical protein
MGGVGMSKTGLTYRRALLFVVAMVLVVIGGHQAHAARPGDNVLTVLLVPDNSTFDLRANELSQGPFYIGGTLFDVDTGEELGAFQCWGWFFTASRRVVTQEYNLGDRGTIILAGEEIVNTLALVGGTGDFRNARGETEFEFVPEGVLVHFTLIGANANP